MYEIIKNNPISYQIFTDRYLHEGETIEDRMNAISEKYSDSEEQKERIKQYISDGWFMPSTPILHTGGRNTGLPISCYLNEVQDNMDGIHDVFSENFWLSANGGGIGTYWGNVRSIGEKIGENGHTSGIIPFLKVQDSYSLAISQGNIRRGSSAAYLHVSHPEIEEFVDIRRPTGTDVNRRCMNIHHGVCITDKFMEAVIKDDFFDLISPKTKKTIKKIKARDLWIKILNSRIETGEPYLFFVDNANKDTPYNDVGRPNSIKTSNLCSEITLATGRYKTAICCLASVNLEYFDEFKNKELFYYDIVNFLDNVLEDFIDKGGRCISKAADTAIFERNIGIGVMGYHAMLQNKLIPFESKEAEDINQEIFSTMKNYLHSSSKKIADKNESAPTIFRKRDLFPYVYYENSRRNLNVTAIAPTATISIINGCTSPGVDPIISNIFNHKTLSGTHTQYNKELMKLLAEKKHNTSEIWDSIKEHNGSVQHLGILSEHEKNVFKTAFEISQMEIVKQATERQKYIDQSQSINLFFYADVSKKYLHEVHLEASKGMKSLYYVRSMSVQRPENISCTIGEECQSCQ